MAISPIPEAVRALADSDERGLAVFDADGVLWHGDIAEDFVLWMIGEGLFDGRLWPVYERCAAEDLAASCSQLLSFFTGMDMNDVRSHVERFWQVSAERRWLTRIRSTVRWARRHEFTVLVVSATPSVVLAPVYRHLEVDRVLGLELEVDDAGRATGYGAGIATIGVGKAERIRAETRLPVRLAVGNSLLDIPMLRLSSGVAWAINPDQALREAAERAGWLISTEAEG